MQKRIIASAILSILLFLPVSSPAAPDTYIGDAAIYSAIDTGSERPKPHVLLLVDTSVSTMDFAAGIPYDPDFQYDGDYLEWGVYFADNKNAFDGNLVKDGVDADLSGIPCNNANLKNKLTTVGTYAASGLDGDPSLKKSGNAGTCVTGNNSGAFYALGNFLNYKDSPPPEGNTLSQREIIYRAVSQVVDGSRQTVKFATMTYSPSPPKGGVVVSGMSELTDDGFNSFLKDFPGPGKDDGAQLINSNTARPMATALFDAGIYLGARYPKTGAISSNATFPLALPSSSLHADSIVSPGLVVNPANRNECGYNHIILITNGAPRGDEDNKLLPLIDADGDGKSAAEEAEYGQGTHYLDDVAAYLFKQEKIITHTVLAFQTEDALVRRAAHVGGGEYYNVYNANELADALTKLLASIVFETDTSFVAPVVPASSTNRTISSNRVYLGLFKPQSNRPWLGNLKKYGVSSDLTLLDKSNAQATDAIGDFLPESKSHWGAQVGGADDGKIMSIDGLLPLSAGSVAGDGGNVAAGGVGGTLKLMLQAGRSASPVQKAWEVRNIYTNPSDTSNIDLTSAASRFSPDNTNITATMLDVADDTQKNQLIAFVAGADGFDDNIDGDPTEIRDWPLGDILHSKPLIFSYSSFTEAQEDDYTYNKSMVFVGSNDGMLHAFKDADGTEAWAFIPDNLVPKLKYLRENDHNYFSDSPPVAYVHDVNNDNIIQTADGDKVVLVFGQGRGGGRSTLDATGSRGAYYALDVSNPLTPVLLWKVDSDTTGFGELGETWSTPRLARVKLGAASKIVAFIGAGYDNNEDLRFGNNMLFPASTTATNITLPTHDSGAETSLGSSAPLNPRGRGVYAIEVARLTQDGAGIYSPNFDNSGEFVWGFTHSGSNGMDYSIPSDLTVLDMNGDGFSDRIYAGDTGGRIWRFDVGDTVSATNWTGRMIFDSNSSDGTTTKGRKIFYKPTIALTNGLPTLYFGTGDRNHPLNTAVTDRMYAVRDRGQTTADAIDNDDLKDMTDNELQASDTTTAEISVILDDLNSATNYGWYIDLERAGEKILAPTLVFNKHVFYTSYMPQPVADLDQCQIGNLGISRVYQLDYATAEAVRNYYAGNDYDTTYANNVRAKGGDGIALQKEDREKEIGVGIPSGIVTLIDASGKVTLMISSSNRVGTYQAPDAKMISPLYWMQY